MVGQTRRGTPYTAPPPPVSSVSSIQALQVASSPLPQLNQMASNQPANVGQMQPPVMLSSNWSQNNHTPMMPPCVGGITTDNVLWTGGSLIPSLANVEPETACALHSKHVKDANNTYTNCTKGIDSKLDMMDPRTKEFPTPLKTFQKLLWEYLKDHGIMDMVFRVTLPSGDKCCLVTEPRFYDNYSWSTLTYFSTFLGISHPGRL